MRKQVLVIGLGQFGMALAESLSRKGADVLAVDGDPRLVQEASAFAAQAAAFDASDEDALARAEPARRDVAVCAIGPVSREASILVTALLRQMGAPRIIARAADDLHARILRLVGAHETVNPERAVGERLASRLVLSGLVDEVPVGDDLVLSEVRVPLSFVGRPLQDLALPRRFSLTVVAIRPSQEAGAPRLPTPKDLLREGEILVLAGRPGAVASMLERV